MPIESPFPLTSVGHGPVRVIVVHGWMGDHRLYADFFPWIDAKRFHYAFFDCRGYGGRRQERGDCTVEAMAHDVIAVADALGWDRFHVLGHSMGGMAAQRLMADAPARLHSAILLASVPASGARISDDRRALLTQALRSPAARRALIDANTGHCRDAAWLDRVLDLSLAGTRPEAMERYLASWTGAGFRADIEGSLVPVLALMGELDPGTPADRGQSTFLRWYPNAKAQALPGVGHYPMLEAPERLAAVLGEYLSTAR
jgi:pimeloyl-ACP methyl ester carboxylesterase